MSGERALSSDAPRGNEAAARDCGLFTTFQARCGSAPRTRFPSRNLRADFASAATLRPWRRFAPQALIRSDRHERTPSASAGRAPRTPPRCRSVFDQRLAEVPGHHLRRSPRADDGARGRAGGSRRSDAAARSWCSTSARRSPATCPTAAAATARCRPTARSTSSTSRPSTRGSASARGCSNASATT